MQSGVWLCSSCAHALWEVPNMVHTEGGCAPRSDDGKRSNIGQLLMDMLWFGKGRMMCADEMHKNPAWEYPQCYGAEHNIVAKGWDVQDENEHGRPHKRVDGAPDKAWLSWMGHNEVVFRNQLEQLHRERQGMTWLVSPSTVARTKWKRKRKRLLKD